MYCTGVYRLLNTKNFIKEKGIGFGIELFFTIALLSLQLINNVKLTPSSIKNQLISQGSLRSISIFLKFAALFDLLVEIIFLVYEVCRLNTLRKKNIVVVRY
jgi:hypothetical protein